MKIFFSTLLCSLFSIVLFSQSPFVLRLGTAARWEEARAITRTEDGNFMIAGCRTDSNNKRKGLVFKMEPDGTVIWAKLYGGNALGNTTSGEDFYDIIYLGGYYYCVGSTVNWVNDPSPNVARADVLLVKLKPNGNVVWAKNFGSPLSQTSGSLGNEVGFGLVPNYLGGVLISVRINSGNATNQNTGFISVDTDGKVRWAYQYDLTTNASTNELVDRVWKADHQSYVAGGWFNNAVPSQPAGMLMKLDRDGNLSWSKRVDWGSSSSLFESMYSGYYNYKNGKIYSTDYYSPGSSSTVRAVNIMTNLSSDGTAPPTTGGNVQAKSIHYATPTTATNNHRGYLFPVGDGTEYMISSAYSVAYANSTSYPALLAKVNTDLSQSISWQQKVGFDSMHNKIVDLIPCDENNQDMIGVGTVRNASGYDILVVRVNTSGTSQSCVVTDTRNHSSLTETTSNLTMQRINLNSGCPSSCWAENDTITGLSVQSESLTGSFCGAMKMDAPESEFLDYIIPKVESITGGAKISFGLTKPTVQLIFELKTPTGEIVFERVIDDPAKMEAGLKISPDTGYEAGNYVWTIIATYSDEEGIEIKEGEIVVQ